MTIAEQYADYATTLQYDHLPTEVVDHAKKLILDIIANAIGGHAWMDSGPSICPSRHACRLAAWKG